MAYHTGSAANVAAVLTALTNACVDEGWTWSGGILSKADPGIFVRLDAATALGSCTPLRMWARSTIDGSDSPQYVSMGIPIRGTAVTYPVIYHIFVFTDEVFMVIQYSDKYQWLAFGQSDQPGLGGTGNWISATCGAIQLKVGVYYYPSDGVYMLNTGLNSQTYEYTICPGLGWSLKGIVELGKTASWSLLTNLWVDVGLDSGDDTHPWMYTMTNNSIAEVGIRHLVELIATQPNAFNNEGILLPIKIIKVRASSKFSQVLQVQNARNLRIDNYTSEEIIQLGMDQWMVFPWYRKSTTVRDGGIKVDHTGTFGWAIKYEPVT